MRDVESNSTVLIASSRKFLFVPRHFYCAETFMPANAFDLSADTWALLEGEMESKRCCGKSSFFFCF